MDIGLIGSQCIMNLSINSLCSNLGFTEDGVFITSDDCEDVLSEFLKNLQEENPVERSYRRQLSFSRVVEIDIIPLLKFVKDQPEVFSAAIRFLTLLIQPIECLTVGMPAEVELPWLHDIEKMLIDAQRLCSDKDLICAITNEIEIVLDDHNGEPMEEETCDFINKCLLLFRNLLYIKDQENQNCQEKIIIFLLQCNLGEIIKRLVALTQREYWCASIIQLVSLMYTRQTLEILKPCLNLDSTEEESWPDRFDRDEDFTVPCHLHFPEEEDKEEEKKPTSLMGLFQKNLTVKELPDTQTEGKYFKNGFEMETVFEKNEDYERPEDYRPLILKFTKEFISECFGFLVNDLKNVLISEMKDYLDDTYFLWAVSFFLKIARREDMPFKVVRLVLTTELVGFLAYEGVILTEQLLIAQKRKFDSSINARRLHLTVTALNEIFRTLTKFSAAKDLDDFDQEYLTGLQKDLANLNDLRMVFILLIRHYQIKDTNLDFLEDLIITNHTFLELMDTWDKNGWADNFSMVDHIKLYGSRIIMHYYGTLLENFETNTYLVNKCVFTMMHHIAGDCGKPEILMQMNIIQALMEVDGTKNHMTKEMNDLTEYLLNRFANLAKNDPYVAAQELYGLPDKEEEKEADESSDDSEATDSGNFSETTDMAELDDMLFSLYTEHQSEDDMMEKIIESLAENGITASKQKIWSRLFACGLITHSQYVSKKKLLPEDKTKDGYSDDKDVVKWCVKALREKHQEENLKWLQTLLCETAYIKLGKECEKNLPEEPVVLFHVLRESSVPVVMYKEEQESMLNDRHFTALLHYLGFHTPQDVNMVFPRIPSFWTSEQLIKQAEKLGPISEDILKFDPASVKYEDELGTFNTEINTNHKDEEEKTSFQPVVRNDGHNIFWLKQIQQYNEAQEMTGK